MNILIMAGHGGSTVITTLANNKSIRRNGNKLGALKSQVRVDYIKVQGVTLMGNLVSASNKAKVERLVEKRSWRSQVQSKRQYERQRMTTSVNMIIVNRVFMSILKYF
jgi:hypothetical protein